ncbi:poly(A) RNA polymerase gld-2 homolog A-like [Lycorma delicatula]|uniref:poly(A) RNA polymerase gld-2 homolog A-like n=1 Tax=Lycorma delicatula TaxID=130591 RepID=UPI003F515958
MSGLQGSLRENQPDSPLTPTPLLTRYYVRTNNNPLSPSTSSILQGQNLTQEVSPQLRTGETLFYGVAPNSLNLYQRFPDSPSLQLQPNSRLNFGYIHFIPDVNLSLSAGPRISQYRQTLQRPMVTLQPQVQMVRDSFHPVVAHNVQRKEPHLIYYKCEQINPRSTTPAWTVSDSRVKFASEADLNTDKEFKKPDKQNVSTERKFDRIQYEQLHSSKMIETKEFELRPSDLWRESESISSELSTIEDIDSLPIIKPSHTPAPMDVFLNMYSIIFYNNTPSNFYDANEIFPRLSRDIYRLHIKNEQPIKKYTEKIKIWKNLYLLLKKRNSAYNLFIMGSTVSGLSVSNSDMDLCLTEMPVSGSGTLRRDVCYQKLCKVLHILRKGPEFGRIILVDAKVPVLRIFMRKYEINIDINFSHIIGLWNTPLLFAYTKCDWRLRPLFSVIKVWAYYHNINEPFKKTLSSYSLSLLVIFFLQYGTQPPVLPCLQDIKREEFEYDKHDITQSNQTNIYESWNCDWHSESRDSLGKLLTQFFIFYDEFNFEENIISVRLGKSIPVKKNEDKLKGNFIQVEEPFTLKNVAYSVHTYDSYKTIKNHFKMARLILSESETLDDLFKY